MKRALAFTLMVLAIMIIAVSCEEPQAQVHEHTYATEWSHDDTFHWHASACGHEDVVSDKEEHKWKEGGDKDGWITEKAATETEKGSAYRICTVCEYKDTKVIQELSHKHTYSKYDWSSDKHWRTCTSCGEKFTYSHSLSYKTDSDTHYQECYCGYSTTKEAHTYETKAAASDGGTIQECTVCKYQVTLTKKAETVVKVSDISSMKDKDGNVAITAGVTAEETNSTSQENETTVTFPDGALKVKDDATKVTLTVVAAPVSVASLNGSGYQINTDGEGATSTDANTENAVVAGFEFKLEGAESSDLSGTTAKTGTTVTTYIARGLTGAVTKEDVADETNLSNKIQIKYVGSNTGKNPEIVSYNNNSGKLVFKVYHFSKYIVISDLKKATDDKGNMYNTLSSAISEAEDGARITLLADDNSLSGTTIVSKSISLNLNGKKVNGNGKLKVSSENVVTIESKASGFVKLITSGVKVGDTDSDVGTYYPTLAKAIEKVEADSTIVLLENVSGLESAIGVKKSVTLDLNGKTITSSAGVFAVHSGTLNIENGASEEGKIGSTQSNNTGYVISIDCSNGNAGVVIGEKVTVAGTGCSGIKNEGASSYTATLDISGTITSSGTSVYQPSKGSLTINKNASLTSTTSSAVEIDGGNAVIYGGTLTTDASYPAEISGKVVGASVAVAQNNSQENIVVSIYDGTFSAKNGKQLVIVNPNSNAVEYTKNVKVVVGNNVKMSSDKIVGTKTGDSSGIDGTYYFDSASAIKAGINAVARVVKKNNDYENYGTVKN